MSNDMIPMVIKGVVMPSQADSPMVILGTKHSDTEFAINVGASEASTILMTLEGISTPRPLTHELMLDIFEEQGIKLASVELYGKTASDEDSCIAKIKYTKLFKTYVRDVRPSDALALAIKSKAQIFVQMSLIELSEKHWFTACSVTS